MTTVSDNFVRADNPSLGANWKVVSLPPGDGGIELKSNAFAPAAVSQTGFPTSVGVWNDGSSFNPYQYSTVQVSAFAAQQSVVSISAASQSGNTTTYTYTLSSGSALQNPQGIIISGMADAGNNGNFVISNLGSGTFDVVNASGVTRGSQTGTGTSATDSLCGPLVRASSDGQNGYFVYLGNNSGYVARNDGLNDSRLFVREVWKIINGSFIEILQQLTSTTMADSANDIYHLFALGNKIALYKNKVVVSASVDNSLISGLPGIMASSANGAGHSMPLGANTGVNGTQFTNFTGSDLPLINSGWTVVATETFATAGAAPNPPYSQITGFTTVPIFANGETRFNVSDNRSMIHTGRTWNPNQASSIVISTTTGNTSIDVCTRGSSSSQTMYLGQFIFTNGLGAGTFNLVRFVNGVSQNIGTAAGSLNFADVLRLESVGTTHTLKKNGVAVVTATDTNIVTGSPGALGGGAAFIMFWSGDEVAANVSGDGGSNPGDKAFIIRYVRGRKRMGYADGL